VKEKKQQIDPKELKFMRKPLSPLAFLIYGLHAFFERLIRPFSGAKTICE
jgi:hypothetical protein